MSHDGGLVKIHGQNKNKFSSFSLRAKKMHHVQAIGSFIVHAVTWELGVYYLATVIPPMIILSPGRITILIANVVVPFTTYAALVEKQVGAAEFRSVGSSTITAAALGAIISVSRS